MSNRRPLIAVVDDDESVCKALRRLIVASDMDAMTFVSGQTFLDSLPDHRPDCVVLDLHLPQMSGMDVLRALANATWQLPVIVITGRDEPASRARCLSAGALAYLAKPLDQASLLQAIGEAVRGAPGRVRQDLPDGAA
ncbi:Response regulator receiver domain-containing protein [Rhizobiales bacterium GAS113]|nr:Response regulator receiver domain-containing protein [Rhizobiales bacterium GAS113]